MKKTRGFVEEQTSLDQKWVNCKVIKLASNYVGAGTMDTAMHWSKLEKKYVDVSRPQIIKECNKSMGGVDKVDSLIALYCINFCSRKWTLRDIFHFVDMAVCNAWLLYVINAMREKMPIKEIYDLLHLDRKSTRLNSSHLKLSRMPSSA